MESKRAAIVEDLATSKDLLWCAINVVCEQVEIVVFVYLRLGSGDGDTTESVQLNRKRLYI